MPSKSLHILVVDDEPAVLEFLAAVLSEEGHTVVTSRSGAEALQKLRSADLLITDHHMPGSLSGLKLVQLARRTGFTKPIVASSGFFTPELTEEYRRAGVTAFLPKPINVPLLITFVAAAAKLMISQGVHAARPAQPPPGGPTGNK